MTQRHKDEWQAHIMFYLNVMTLKSNFPGEDFNDVLARHAIPVEDMSKGPIMERIRQTRIDGILGDGE